MPPFSKTREKRLAIKRATEAQEKTTTEASSIKKKPQIYLRGLNLKQRFGCGHVGCEHKGATEKYMERHMRVCSKRTPAPEKES